MSFDRTSYSPEELGAILEVLTCLQALKSLLQLHAAWLVPQLHTAISQQTQQFVQVTMTHMIKPDSHSQVSLTSQPAFSNSALGLPGCDMCAANVGYIAQNLHDAARIVLRLSFLQVKEILVTLRDAVAAGAEPVTPSRQGRRSPFKSVLRRSWTLGNKAAASLDGASPPPSPMSARSDNPGG